MTTTIAHQRLRSITRAMCSHMGARENDAAVVADHLVDANLAGHDSHGVGMLPTYVWSVLNGGLKPEAHARVVSDSDALLVLDGQRGFGQVVGMEAMDAALPRARQHGVAVVALRNAHHLGRIGTYAERCAAEGLVSMHHVNVVGHPPYVAPFGGAERRLNTNPYCCAVPREGQPPILLDMATSAIALGKVRVAFNSGARVPEGSIVDEQGHPTTDPAVLFREPGKPSGALAPMGQHKGYGLALICELLGGALAGAWTVNEQSEQLTVVNGMLSVLLDPERLADRAYLQQAVQDVVEFVTSARPAEGVQRVLVPGDPERLSREVRLREGIPIDDRTWSELRSSAKAIGWDPSELERLAAT